MGAVQCFKCIIHSLQSFFPQVTHAHVLLMPIPMHMPMLMLMPRPIPMPVPKLPAFLPIISLFFFVATVIVTFCNLLIDYLFPLLPPPYPQALASQPILRPYPYPNTPMHETHPQTHPQTHYPQPRRLFLLGGGGLLASLSSTCQRWFTFPTEIKKRGHVS